MRCTLTATALLLLTSLAQAMGTAPCPDDVLPRVRSMDAHPLFRAEEIAFLQGAALIGNGKYAEGLEAVQGAVAFDGELEPYARYLAANAQYRLGSMAEAAALMQDFEHFDTIPAAAGLLLDVARRQGFLTQTLGVLRDKWSRERRDDRRFAMMLAVGSSLERARELDRAWNLYLEIVTDNPRATSALEAVERLAALSAVTGRELADLPASKLLPVAQALYYIGDHEDARRMYRLVAETTSDTDVRFDALYDLGMTYYRADDFEGSIRFFEGLLTETTNDGHRQRVVFRLGHSYRSAGRFDDARTLYTTEGCIDPTQGACGRPLISLAYTAMYAGDFDLARQRFSQFLQGNSRSSLADDARFYIAILDALRHGKTASLAAFSRDHRRSPLYKESLVWQMLPESTSNAKKAAIAEDYLDADDPHLVPEVARVYLQEGADPSVAKDLLSRIDAAATGGDVLEGSRLFARLLRSTADVGMLRDASATLDAALLRNQRMMDLERALDCGCLPYLKQGNASWQRTLRTASVLQVAGYGDWARAAFQGIYSRSTPSDAYIQALPVAACFENQYDRVRLSRVLFSRLFGNYETVAFSRLAIRLEHPLAYREFVMSSAERYDVLPEVILGILFTESRFNSEAVSPVGARGATQFIPSTGNAMARALGHEQFDLRRMHEPALAVEFAAAYIDQLRDRFEGRYEMAIASYNGGPHNAANWSVPAALAPHRLEGFSAFIAFEETRKYLARVLSAARSYRAQLEGTYQWQVATRAIVGSE